MENLTKRVEKLEALVSTNHTIQLAYQEATDLYNELGTTLTILKNKLKNQEDAHDQLAAYVDTLPKGGATQDVVYEFERIGAVLGNIFSILDSIKTWQDQNKKVYAIGQSDELVEQRQDARYTYRELRVSDYKNARFSGNSIEILAPGAYRVTVHAYIGSDRWKAGGGADWDWLLKRGVAGISRFGIFVNGSAQTSEEVVTWNGPIQASSSAIIFVNSPTQVGAGCTRTWSGDTVQLMYKSTLIIERIINT